MQARPRTTRNEKPCQFKTSFKENENEAPKKSPQDYQGNEKVENGASSVGRQKRGLCDGEKDEEKKERRVNMNEGKEEDSVRDSLMGGKELCNALSRSKGGASWCL